MRIADAKALTEFAEKPQLWEMAGKIAYRQRFPRSGVEDLVQETLLIMLKAIRCSRVIDDGFPFAFGVIRFLIYAERRKERRLAEVLLTLLDRKSHNWSPARNDPQYQSLSAEARSIIWSVIEQLSPADHLAVADFANGISLETTAQKLGCSITNVWNRRDFAIPRLARAIRRSANLKSDGDVKEFTYLAGVA